MGNSIIAQHLSFGLKLAALILLLNCTICDLTLLSISTSGSGRQYEENADAGGLKQQQWKKPTILGSKPPKCMNKCFSCNPCVAALVAPPNHKAATEGGESYYLLSWRCRCGNKYYQPYL